MKRLSRPAVLTQLDLDRHAVIEASAGTGKTYTLEHLLVELIVLRGASIEEVLVVTFTEKATREMRERLRNKLSEVRSSPGAVAADGGPSVPLDEEALARVEQALVSFDRAPISTIHGFCQRILTEHAFACARLLDQSQVESRPAFRAAFLEELRWALTPGASVRDSGPTTAGGAPVGTADVRFFEVLERALFPLSNSVERLEAALYDWHNERGEQRPRFGLDSVAAAFASLPRADELETGGPLREQLERALVHPSPKKNLPATLQSLAELADAHRAGLPAIDTLLRFWSWSEVPVTASTKRLAYIRHHLRAAQGKDPTLAALTERVETLAMASGTPLAMVIAEFLPRVQARLQQHKSRDGQFDFDDMLRLLRDALFSPEGAALRDTLRKKYRYALVDEFQDTDAIQWDIFRCLFFEGRRGGLVVIGDPKQAIYGFRNADVHTYHAAKREVLRAGGQSAPLSVNYRSTPRVIDAVNTILAGGFFTGINRYENPVTAGRPGRRALTPRGDDAPAVTMLHLVGQPELRAELVYRSLSEAVAERIARLLDGGLRVSDTEAEAAARPLSPSDIHVLCRGRPDVERVGRALAAAGIPYAFYKHDGLFQTDAATDVWVVLHALSDPEDRARRLDAWLTPFFALSVGQVGELEPLAHDRPRLAHDHPLIETLRAWQQLALKEAWTDLFAAMWEDSGYARRERFAAVSERALTDVQHIFEVLLDETHRGNRTLPQLLARLGAFIEGRERPVGESANAHRLESERRAVQVLTMHKSKGLEAEVVFLVGGLNEPAKRPYAPRVCHDDDGRRLAWTSEPPREVRPRVAREQREENERLLYVALTRAKSALYLPYIGPPPTEEGGSERYDLLISGPEPDAAHEPASRQLSLVFGPDPFESETVASGKEQYESKRLNGGYAALNERLKALVAAGILTDPRGLFALDTVWVKPSSARREEAFDSVLDWQPAIDLWTDGEEEGSGVFERLMRGRVGFEVTSYTRLKQSTESPPSGSALGWLEAAVTDGSESAGRGGRDRDEVDDDAGEDRAEALPGGSRMGVFLHHLLEHIPFAKAAEAIDAQEFVDDGEVAGQLFEAASTHGIDDTHLVTAGRLVYRVLRTPLSLPDGQRLPEGLAAVDQHVKEMGFLQPIPEVGHAGLDEAATCADGRPFTIDRGFIRGVIDLIVRHRARYYIIDYKSDRLPDYGAATLDQHVERNYRLQAKLYALGALRALGIRGRDAYEDAFGGMLYLFMRGMAGTGERSGAEAEAAFRFRPTYADVLGWEEELRRADSPFGYRWPPRRRHG